MQDPALARRIQAASQPPDVLDETDAIRTLRASLRVASDQLESLCLDGAPPKGRSTDDRDAYQGWLDRVHGAIAQARAALDATAGFSEAAAAAPEMGI